MRALREVVWIELKLFVREPLTLVFVLVLPLIVLYILNGVFGNQASPEVYEGLGAVDFYLPAYVGLVVATIGVLSLPVHLAGYREQGVLRRFRASALPSWMLVAAHVVVASMVGTAGAILLTLLSTVGYGGRLPEDPARVVLAFVVVTVAFAVLGAFLGVALPTARAAQGLGVLLFFVFLMLGGAGPPVEVLPDTMQQVADVIPLTYGARLLREPWLGRGWDHASLLVMLGLLVASAGLALWRLRTLDR